MTMPTADLIASIGSTVGVGVAIVIVLMRTIARLDRRIDESGADRRAFQAEAAQERRGFQAEAAQDRRAWQASMDTFRAEMQRLAERQSRAEGTQEVHNRAHGTAD